MNLYGPLQLQNSFVQSIQHPNQLVLSLNTFIQMTNFDFNSVYMMCITLHNHMVQDYIKYFSNNSTLDLDYVTNNEVIPVLDKIVYKNEIFNKYLYGFKLNKNILYINLQNEQYKVIDIYLTRDVFYNLIKEMYSNVWKILQSSQNIVEFIDIPSKFTDDTKEYPNSKTFLDKLFLYKYLFRRIYFDLEFFHKQIFQNDKLVLNSCINESIKNALIGLSMQVKKMECTDKNKFEFMKLVDATFEDIYQSYILIYELAEE